MERQELKEVCGALNFVTELIEGLSLGERAASGLYSIHGWERVLKARAAALAELERQEARLEIVTRLNTYVMNGYGELCQKQYYKGPGSFSGSWLFVGAVRTWNGRRLGLLLADVLSNPEALKGHYVIDNDHGTLRKWQGDGPVKAVYIIAPKEGGKLRAVTFPQGGKL